MADRDSPRRGQPSRHDTGTAAGQNELATVLAGLARSMEQEDEPLGALEHIVRSAVDLVPGADEGSISVVLGRRNVGSQAPSADLPLSVDAVQNEVGEGPCLDAAFKHQTVRVPDMRTEQRWPRFAARAAQLGALSMLSCQLYVEGEDLGALNLYARTPDAFDDESEHIALLFAAHAAIAFSAARQEDQLRGGMRTRDLIGQAKGILMERYGIDEMRAFAVLTRASQHTNRKLRDVAEDVIGGWRLPHGTAQAIDGTALSG